MEAQGPPGDFRCPRCEAQFPTWQELDDHRRAAHLTSETGDVRCSTCGELFENAAARDEHEREAHVVPVEDEIGRRA